MSSTSHSEAFCDDLQEGQEQLHHVSLHTQEGAQQVHHDNKTGVTHAATGVDTCHGNVCKIKENERDLSLGEEKVPDQGIGSILEDEGEVEVGQRSKETEYFESSASKCITGQVASGCLELEGAGNELKTIFRDTQREFLSAVCETESELNQIFTSSSSISLCANEQAIKDSHPEIRDSEGNILQLKCDSVSSDSTCNSKDIVGDVHVDSEHDQGNSSLHDARIKSAKLVVDELDDAHVGVNVCGLQDRHVVDASCHQASKVNMDVDFECNTVISSSVNICSNLLAKNNTRTNNNIALEAVRGELFKDIRIVDIDKEKIVSTEKEINFEEKVILPQRRHAEYHGCEQLQSDELLTIGNDERCLKALPLSAPSTPVPSSSSSVRKVLRSQGCRGRRVSFPEDETYLISSYLEPVNPWQQMGGVTVEEIAAAYRSSCERHRTQPLPGVLQQIKALPLAIGGRVECLSLRGLRLEGGQCEGLEEIFRRVQFKILDLEGCSLDDDTAIPLFDMIEFYDSATQLNISCNGRIGFRGWQACSRMLKRTPSVEYLDARNTNLNETNMPILGRALRLGARLHTLHLENCNLTGRPLIMLTAALRQNDTLSELYLAENRLGVNDCIQLGNLVRANNTLRLLDLRNNNVQDVGCSHVCEGIAAQQKQQQEAVNDSSSDKTACVGLNSLILWNNHLTQQSAPHLAAMLAATKTLETLNLGRNNLTSEGILRLKESLLRNHALLRLGLQAARIADEGAVALAEYTADNTAIQHIDLRENPIRVAGLMALAHSLRLNSTIIQMDIDSDPRTEPAVELAEQHSSLQKEIKEYCQRNLTQSHVRASEEHAKVVKQEGNKDRSPNEGSCTSGAIRKISLSCETATSKTVVTDKTEGPNREDEKQKYTSPAPSPLPSPSPSPCASPSPSPVPSPLKNRFRVFKVHETSKSSPELITGSSQMPVLANSIPVSQTGRSMSTGDLSQSQKQNSVQSNRFSSGGRFTVTRVAEPSGSRSLPVDQEKATSITTNYSNASSASGPKIVISSPVRVERGFSVDGTSSPLVMDKNGDNEYKCEQTKTLQCKSSSQPEDQVHPQHQSSGLVRLKSEVESDDVFVDAINFKTASSECQRKDLASQRNRATYKTSPVESQRSEKNSDSLSSSDLTDSGFLDEGVCGRGVESLALSPSTPHPESDRDSLLSSSMDSTSQEDTGLSLAIDRSSVILSSTPCIPLLACQPQQSDLLLLNEPPKRAPLASMENGSFDSDSEDSELTTQSSDSTHSDEVRITTEQYEPIPAWGSKQEPTEVTISSQAVSSSGSPATS
ncbi:LOW QUALITY PROTEIN: protein phosphatase 1 regulatory subunit 37 homolog [Procambarus clarkii]|uniref:LOW QUALITY PROTEIN: protein phosphatase 1 regulatory subunit 37 homolog n=1 Tax=Procambarus clarkii TaxID=6728 RepID=UPI0037431A4B